MELVRIYNRINKVAIIKHITMESCINRVLESYKGRPISDKTIIGITEDLSKEMKSRALTKHFQVRFTFDKGKLKGEVVQVNKYKIPKECVVWN